MSRVAFSRALLAPAQAATWHEAGREYAMRCLVANPTFGESVYQAGDRLTANALAVLPGDLVPCMVFAAAHTGALVQGRGPGAALDLADVTPLLEAAQRLDPSAEAALAAWAKSTEAFAKGNLVDARAAARRAVDLEPGLDFYRHEALAKFPDLVNLPVGADAEWVLENAAGQLPPD